MKRYLLVLLTLLIILQKTSAQQLSPQELLSMQLPPLDTLFEGARKSSMVEFYKYKMEGQELALKTERRKWLEYFSIFGTYQYGIMGINSFTNFGSNYPITYQNSGGEQIWYNVGGSINIPLDKVFDRRNRIRTQQLKIEETLKERDMWYDEQKVKIIGLYFTAMEMINNLNYVIEQTVIADAQYEIAQKDYIKGATTSQSLNVAKGMQVQSYMQMERVKSELKRSIFQLEILSNTKIINK